MKARPFVQEDGSVRLIVEAGVLHLARPVPAKTLKLPFGKTVEVQTPEQRIVKRHRALEIKPGALALMVVPEPGGGHVLIYIRAHPFRLDGG